MHYFWFFHVNNIPNIYIIYKSDQDLITSMKTFTIFFCICCADDMFFSCFFFFFFFFVVFFDNIRKGWGWGQGVKKFVDNSNNYKTITDTCL